MLKVNLWKRARTMFLLMKNRRTDFGRCDCEQFWKMLNDLLQQAQWSFAPERGSSEAWKSTMLDLTHPVSSRIIKYTASAPCPLSISQCHWEARAVPSIDKLDLIFLWLFAKGKFNKIIFMTRNSCLRSVGRHSATTSLSKLLLGTLAFILH